MQLSGNKPIVHILKGVQKSNNGLGDLHFPVMPGAKSSDWIAQHAAKHPNYVWHMME